MPLFFKENSDPSLQFEVDDVIFSKSTEFQELKIFETKALGRVMVLDDCVMISQKDEFVYHEMISHIPVGFHNSPKTVVVIGGGDGGTVRELVKYSEIEKIILCEIDGDVVEASKRFFPEVACGLDDPRVEIRIGDGIEYVRGLDQFADIILIDSTDPVGPGEGLFTSQFYLSVKKALKKGGVMAAQSESPWLQKEFLCKIQRNISAGFDFVQPYVGSIPTYPMGLWSWTLASQHELNANQFNYPRFQKLESDLKYLTRGQISTIFDVPPFFRNKII